MQKHFGFSNKILRINLTNKKNYIIEPGEEFYRRYVGGRNIALYFLLKELKKGIDPLSSHNKLIFITSPMTGAPLSGLGRHTVAAKSPLTGGFGEAQCGGHWGAELKYAGFDGIIIEGKADKPIYIYIEDSNIKILSASGIWGKNTSKTVDFLRDIHGKDIKVSLIGPAGENLVRYANITADCINFAGRCGLGAVMGSKQLKAIVVKARNKEIRIADPEKLAEISKWFSSIIKDHPYLSISHKYGTAYYISIANEIGALPTYNFQESTFKNASDISGEKIIDTLGAGSRTCRNCSVACRHLINWEDKKIHCPEAESVIQLGSLLGVSNLDGVIKSCMLCDEYGMDTISTGVTLAWAVECFERGILKKEDTLGIKLKWNDPETYHKLIEMITKREGFGNILAEGSLRASKKIGKGSMEYAMQVKGQELPSHEVRGKWSVALGFAVSPTGADHLQAAHDPIYSNPGDYSQRLSYANLADLSPLGLIEPVPLEDLSSQKVRTFMYLQFVWSYHDILDWCIFTNVPEERGIDFEQQAKCVEYVTGWRTSIFELLKKGEMGINMARSFNVREGFTSSNDVLPKRLFEPLPSGPLKGHQINSQKFKEALALYYGMMGWDKNGIPTYAKLEELGIGWIWDHIKKEHIDEHIDKS